MARFLLKLTFAEYMFAFLNKLWALLPRRERKLLATHVVRLVALALADLIVRPALHFGTHDAFVDIAERLFFDGLVLYWLYGVLVDLLNNIPRFRRKRNGASSVLLLAV